MAEIVTCARHPSVETGLKCVQCLTPICPRCAKDAAVGMRCPDCARPDRGGGLRRRPQQLGRAVGVGVVGAVVGAAVLGVMAVYVGFFQVVVSFFAGLVIARRVREAASGNTVDVIRWVAMTSSAAAVLGGEFVALPLMGYVGTLSPYVFLQLAAAVYAAYREMQ